jgi:deoxyhypusine synthase
MRQKNLLKFPTKPIEISSKDTISELLHGMRSTAFQGRKLGEVADVWTRMLKKKECVVWLGLAGALVPGGLRKVLSYLIRRHIQQLGLYGPAVISARQPLPKNTAC